MKRWIFITMSFVLTLGINASFSQQRPQYSQYMFNGYLLNPAIGGIEDYADFKLGFRKQWVGIPGAPETYYLSGHASIGKFVPSSGVVQRRLGKRVYKPLPGVVKRSQYGKMKPHQGVGTILQVDKTGPLSSTTFYATYAVHMPIYNNVNISVGAAPGVMQYKLDGNAIKMKRDGDPLGGSFNEVAFDLGLGTYLYSDRFYLGASGQQLLNADLDLTGLDSYNVDDKLRKHFFFTGGYKFFLNQDVALQPSVLVKMSPPSPTSVDVNLKASFQDLFWVGTSYRHKDAVVFLTGANVNHLLEIGYSYDLTISRLNKVNYGTHEILVGLKVNNRSQVFCPSFLW